MDEPLFDALPVQARPEMPSGGRPRLRRPERDQVALRALSLDDLLPAEHRVRLVWAFVAGLDLEPLYARIKAVAGRPGHPPADPRLLMALWLFATIEGVGSARALARLCREHLAFQWLCGGVGVNHKTLADVRVGHGALLERLLIDGFAALLRAGVASLERVAQDGVRVRASAGAASFRRRSTLHACRRQAEAQVARASTTDPAARVMKMADGGWRPAYNAQVAADTTTGLIAGVAVDTSGSDMGHMAPMSDALDASYGVRPSAHLVDGGFARLDDIAALAAAGVTVYAPVPEPRDPGRDRYAPRPDDPPAVAAWRRRMGTDAARAIYKDRAATAEWVNAQARNRGLTRLLVRGTTKVKAVLLWFALAHNLTCLWRPTPA